MCHQRCERSAHNIPHERAKLADHFSNLHTVPDRIFAFSMLSMRCLDAAASARAPSALLSSDWIVELMTLTLAREIFK